MHDLESKLRASLPGRATEVQDYARLTVAWERVQQAILLLRASRGSVATILGNDRPAVEHIADADIEASKAMLDLERAIKAHPAGKQR